MSGYWDRRSTRRRFLATSTVLGGAVATGALAGCKGSDNRSSSSSSGAAAAIKPGVVPYTSSVPSAAGARPGGDFIVALASGPTTLWDPYRASTNVVQHYSAIFDTLLQNDPKSLTYKPGLLESWEEVEPGLHYIFKLRSGVTWENKPPTNGRPFDVDDVIYNIKYGSGMLDPSSKSQISRADWYGDIASVTAPDPQHVDVKLASPNAGIFGVLADMRQFAIPREIPGTMSFNDYAKFPSIGPFLTKSYVNGQSAEYMRNPNYWNKPYPYVETTKLKFYGDGNSAVAALLTGEVDFFEIRASQYRDPVLKSHAPVAAYPFPFRGYDVIYINGQRYPDKRVWVALNYLWDKKTNADALYGPGYWEYSGPLNRVLPGATPADKIAQLPGYNPATRDRDIKSAMAMLAAAGHADGDGLAMVVTISGPNSSGTGFDTGVRFQAALKQYAPKMKFDIRVTPDASSFQRAIAVRDYDMIVYSIFDSVDVRLAVSSWTTGHSRNYANYSNPQLDSLVKKSFSQSYEESLSTIKDIEKILLDGVPLIVPDGIVQVLGMRTSFDGLEARVGPGAPGPGNDSGFDRKYVWSQA